MTCGCKGAKCRLEPGDKRHGTTNGYSNHGCRCEACREANRERDSAYRAANREAALERKRAYRAANQEAVREYFKANREARREYYKAHYAANPDMHREYVARRRARKANAFIGPAFTRQQVWGRDSGICHICGQPADPNDWHLEHVVPLVRGGAHSFDNCAVSCPPCNLRKGTRLLDELAAECTLDTVSN